MALTEPTRPADSWWVNFDAFTHFSALLALGALIGTAAVIAARYSGSPKGLAMAIGDSWLALGATVAVASTIGSLLYSEAYDLIPCRLCWYQRIFMYPLAVVLLVAWVRRDPAGARRYAPPLALIGLPISIYHYLVQHFPNLESTACLIDVPCSAAYVWRYGFVSIPFMAIAGFASILVLLWAGPGLGLTAPSEPSEADIP